MLTKSGILAIDALITADEVFPLSKGDDMEMRLAGEQIGLLSIPD